MSKIDILILAFKNIINNKLKFSLVLISICIGISSVTIISSIGNIAEKMIAYELSSMGIDGITIIDTSDEDILDDDVVTELTNKFEPDVIMPIINTYGNFTNNRVSGNAVIWGVNTDVSELLKLDFLAGDNFQNNDIYMSKNVVIIDENLANSLYERTNIVGKYITIIINGVREEFEVIGVISNQKAMLDSFFGSNAPSFLYIPITTLSNLNGQINYDQIAIRNDSDLDSMIDDIEYYYSKKSDFLDKISVQNISSYMNSITLVVKYVSLLLTTIAGISMIVACIGVINIMLSSAFERKKEIGIYLSLGAKKIEVGLVFFTEALIICFFSGVLGAFVGTLIIVIICLYLEISIIISLITLFQMIMLSIICGIISGIFPCIKACKLNPIDVLRD